MIQVTPPVIRPKRVMKASVDETDSMINNLACHRSSMLIYQRFIDCCMNKLNSDDPAALHCELLCHLVCMARSSMEIVTYNKRDIL